MRYLAIDYGFKRTGIAICDASETIVSPYSVIDSQKGLIDKIITIIKAENVGAVVVGLPLNMDDSKGSQAQLSEKFAQRLKAKLNIPVYFQDERLSSYAAEEKLAPAQYSRAQKKARLDAIAAAEILELFLQQKSSDNQALE